eukprot:scaffold115534_cov78-Phaeocystis_antarctica.AAC.1
MSARSESAVGTAQVSDGLTTEQPKGLGSMHCMQGGRACARGGCHGAMVVLYSGCLGTIGVTRGMAGGLGTCQDAVGSDLEATRMWR